MAIASFASGDRAPSFAPCTVRSRTRPMMLSTELSAESAVVSQASPLSTLREYCAVAAASAAHAEGARRGRRVVRGLRDLPAARRLVVERGLALQVRLQVVLRVERLRSVGDAGEHGYLPTNPVWLMSMSRASSTAVITRAAPW